MATLETKTQIIVDMLTTDSVSIVKKEMTEVNGQTVQVGDNWRRAFVNSTDGRKEISEFLPEPQLSAVMSVWGNVPTVDHKEAM